MAYLPYSAITFLQLRQYLASRLADPTNQFWTDAENGIYISEALQVWNALTSAWLTDFPFTPTNGQLWYSIPALANSPRVRTVTDTDLYTIIEYHLLEPPTGATWTGTTQFGIGEIAGAIQRRRDELIQFTACNLATATYPASNARRTVLSPTTLEVLRAQYVPASGSSMTLFRDDGLSLAAYEPGYLQASGNPESYNISSTPPLQLEVDQPPSPPGTYNLVTLQSGAVIDPLNAPTLIGIPDDWCWAIKWGAMSDLLGRESEATDIPRAQYCLKRYQDAVKLMMGSPWMVLAQINGVPVDTPSMMEMDAYSVGWDTNPNQDPTVVSAGVDFVAVAPLTGSTPNGVMLTLLQNAPLPVLDTDPVQVSPDTVDVILDYAQHLACFKQGGQEFMQTKVLASNFVTAAAALNSRIRALGIFRDLLLDEGNRETEAQQRFLQEQQK